jgi:hypothetical protein
VAERVEGAESVWVAVGALKVAVSVTGENAVFVAGSVFPTVAGGKVGVELQASNARIRRIGKMFLRFIR